MHRYFDKSLDIHFVIYFGNEKKGVVVAIVAWAEGFRRGIGCGGGRRRIDTVSAFTEY